MNQTQAPAPMSEWGEARRHLMTPATIAANARLHREGTAYDTGHRDGSSGASSNAWSYPRTLPSGSYADATPHGSAAVAKAIQRTRDAYTKGYEKGQADMTEHIQETLHKAQKAITHARLTWTPEDKMRPLWDTYNAAHRAALAWQEATK